MLSELFHTFSETPVNIVLPKLFTCPFCYTPHPLTVMAANDVQRYLAARTDWADELAQGKMFGVLVVKNADRQLGFLAAFSGNIAGSGVHNYFVPPIYDITTPGGYFKTEESAISELNRHIVMLENDPKLCQIEERLTKARQQACDEIARFKELARQHKTERDNMRQQSLTIEKDAELIRQSQFEKAEQKRIERRWASEVAEIEAEAAAAKLEIDKLKKLRRQKSEALQAWLFEHYVVLNARGEQKNIRNIFAEERGVEPPAATGECAAPKLLQFAYKNNYQPVAMAEFWWGQSPAGEVRHHGAFYPV